MATQKMKNSYIPNSVAFSILSKLPFKSLKRLSCSNKSWSLLFQNPSFMALVKNNLTDENSDVSLLQLSLSGNELYSFFGERFEDKIKLDTPRLINIQEFDFFGFSSVNDIFCLVDSAYLLSQRVVLWNPTTTESEIIYPKRTVMRHIKVSFNGDDYPKFFVHGFGYDCVEKDYKVIRHIKFVERSYVNTLWEIYSIKNRCWRRLKLYIPVSYSDHLDCYVYNDGMCHWLSDMRGLYLVSFDLNKEVHQTTPIPYMDKTLDLDKLWIQLIVLKGSIALISHRKSTTTFQISILGEIGAEESWTKLFTVEMTPNDMYPIRTEKNAEIFFIGANNKLTWWEHLITSIYEELKDEDCEHNPLIYYEKSLLST